MDEVFQDQQERENLSGAQEEPFLDYFETFADWYRCPYCGTDTRELELCCDELHGQRIGDL